MWKEESEKSMGIGWISYCMINVRKRKIENIYDIMM